MLKEKLAERDYLPILQMNDGTPVTAQDWPVRRAELRAAMEKDSYGVTPALPVKVTGTVTFTDNNAYAGKVIEQKITLTYETERGSGSFPIELFVPKTPEKPPVFLHLAFRPVPDRYIPVEEITDGGYALAVVVYTDIMNDAHFGDFSGGVAAHFGTNLHRGPEVWGKIGMWAWGASRVMDYLIENRTDVDTDHVAVIGHSRLGKTALWCAALDERIAAAVSNDSGYGGAASSKHGTGERVTDFIRVGSWDWYCENFKKYTGALEDAKPYDQSFMLAMIAPRLLIVGSAAEDRGADPAAEFLTTLHASAAWELLGEKGLICPDRMPEPGDLFAEGSVGYHLRGHRHYLSREDWGAYMRFLDGKWKQA